MNSREQFEQAFPVPSNIRWAEEHQSYGYIVRNSPNLTQVHRYRSMWNAWQASRRALEIKLPDDGIADCERDWGARCKDTFDCGYNYACLQHEKAIEAAGVRVKE